MFPTTNIFAISILLMTNMTQGSSEVLRRFPDDEGGIADNRLLRKKSTNLGLYIGIGGGAVVLAGVGAFVIWKVWFSETTEKTPAAGTSSAADTSSAAGTGDDDIQCAIVEKCPEGLEKTTIKFGPINAIFGANCKDSSECASRSCVETKCAAVGYGKNCGGNKDCLYGTCLHQRCRGDRALGDPCQVDGECATANSYCVETKCAAKDGRVRNWKEGRFSNNTEGVHGKKIPVLVHKILKKMGLRGTQAAIEWGPKFHTSLVKSTVEGTSLHLVGDLDDETVLFAAIYSRKKNPTDCKIDVAWVVNTLKTDLPRITLAKESQIPRLQLFENLNDIGTVKSYETVGITARLINTRIEELVKDLKIEIEFLKKP